LRLLITRPEREAERTAAALAARGHQVDTAPLLRIEAIPDVPLGAGPWSALVITSANALPAIAVHPRHDALLRLPLFAVGRRTATQARAAGFAEVAGVGANLSELVQVLRTFASAGASIHPLLYLAGEDRSGDLAAALEGVVVTTAVIYRALKSTAFPPAVAGALGAAAVDGVLHYSRRSAEAYLECARAGRLLGEALAPIHFCLSDQVAAPLLAAGAKRVRVAARPEETALIALIEPDGASRPC
jgi:uroporphyrinogen-III synthase